MKKIFYVFSILIISITLIACNRQKHNLNYTLNDVGNGYIVSIGSCMDSEIKIPSKYNGKPIVEIGESGFKNCNFINKLIIPDGIVKIGEWAFSYCTSLTSITIPKSVRSIENWAFSDCYSLVEVINKSSLNIEAGSSLYGNIGCYAKQVITDKSQSKLTVKKDFVIYDKTCLVKYIGDDKNVVVPKDFKEISDYAFYRNSSLISVVVPESVKSIGDSAFEYCTSLTKITIQEGITRIGNSMFSECTSLTSITIPESVTSIEDWAFYNCKSLTSIEIPNSITSIGEWAFFCCEALTNITIPKSITSIGTYAFYNCGSLISINYEETIEQWEKISKGNNWNKDVPSICKVICLDKEITIN